jgi:hypothetical protein
MNIQKFLVLGFLLFIGSCKEKPTTPIDPDAALPAGRRDYTWTVDTLNFHSSSCLPVGIWGNSPNDVWLIAIAGNIDETIWHYDGQQWSPQVLPSENYITPYSICGFASNDIWISGQEGRILHYDGQSWTLFAEFSPIRPVEYPYVFCNSLWGDAPNNVWIAGFMQSADGKKAVSCILHYDGQRWDFVSIPNIPTDFIEMRRGKIESSKYYLTAYTSDSSGMTVKFFEFDGLHGVTEIFSTRTTTLAANVVNERLYFADGKRLLKYNGAFQIFRDFSSTGFKVLNVFGRNVKDMFVISINNLNPQSSVLRHYNGTDLATLYDRIDFSFSGLMVYKSEVFCLGSSLPNYAPIVIHGKLKN